MNYKNCKDVREELEKCETKESLIQTYKSNKEYIEQFSDQTRREIEKRYIKMLVQFNKAKGVK